ncbi:Stk1 family PASTA domain-containing Ser/Thr kinase [Inconstantimicrobium mannanitabidum]|uniref:Protein kinase n=1 Tax=Inconstantimicrobium mannanitabidum TaxID=1604901 RepID=A0ACB5RB73_9CLOT|nr:Stk1 family PASTA domain-containing Ser/Thr kinase [Clostridium sp. TW13]GKX66260.1 protein kinase [Clostridium sp. TW13]
MIGKILGDRYEIIEKIGEGGMSYVYKAKCHKLNRFVAIKILKEAFNSNQEIVEKFKREATAIANLINANIVNILDVGTQDDVNYIVMEYINGKTLKQIINENGKMSYQAAINIGIKVANALDCAHRNNVIHRDIKPQNIMVTPEGIVKVTDFGIAKSVDAATISFTTSVMGSAHYFSPEQAKGSYVDCRTDLYSLGVVMYEMVTGRVPFDGDSPVSIAVKHLQEEVVPPKNINPAIPLGLNEFILKAMGKEPVKRYQSAKEMIVDLEKILNDPNVVLNVVENENDFTRIMQPVNVPLNTSATTPKKKVEEDDEDEDYDDDYDEEEDEDPAKKKKRKKKNFIIYGIIIIALIGLAAGGALVFANVMNQQQATTQQIKVPTGLVGKNKDDVKKAIEDAGLVYMEAGNESSETVPQGSVTKVYPAEGTDVKKGDSIRVFVSSGVETVKVPSLVGKYESSAIQALRDAGLDVGQISREFSSADDKDKVIRQSKNEGEDVKKGEKINIVVSKGEEILVSKVPNVSGMKKDDAVKALNDAKFQVNLLQGDTTSDKSKDGIVYSQSQPAGSQVKQGETVEIHYYKYVEPTPDPKPATTPPTPDPKPATTPPKP